MVELMQHESYHVPSGNNIQGYPLTEQLGDLQTQFRQMVRHDWQISKQNIKFNTEIKSWFIQL